jgi:hypothetical protein
MGCNAEMSESQFIIGVTGTLGLTLSAFCIWLLLRALNRKEVPWIVMVALPFMLMAAALALLGIGSLLLGGGLPL